MKITSPGIYAGVSEADYRNDPCPTPSLTQSLAKIIIEKSPHHAWCACPSLNPSFEAEDDTKFDLGNIVHRLILGRGKEIEVIKFDDWRKKAAQDAREEAAALGKIAVLQHQFEQATEMAAAVWLQLEKHEDKNAFSGGRAEVMIAWEEDGIWFRSLIDWLHDDLLTIDDFKSTAKSVSPHMIGHVAEAGGWHLQAAFIERGMDAIDPANAGRRLYRFIAQETDAPHALTTMHMTEHWLVMGRKKVATAMMLWHAAIRTGRWQGYPLQAQRPEYPTYREKQWLERELSGEFEQSDTSLIMAG